MSRHSRITRAAPAEAPLERKPDRASDSRPAAGLLPRQVSDVAAAPPARRNETGLPDRLKAGVERLSGLAMDDVKVHYNSARPAQLRAHAYTQGTQIHVAPGQERHLPHEAWHVVQQKQGRVRPTVQMKGGLPLNDEAGLEREADAMGRRLTAGPESGGRPPQFSARPMARGAPIQRHPGDDVIMGAHDAQDHADARDVALHAMTDAAQEEETTVTRTAKTNVGWAAILEDAPDKAANPIGAKTEDTTGYGTTVHRDGASRKVPGSIEYAGVDDLGQNGGVSALITFDMSSRFKDLFRKSLGKPARGDFPYFKDNADLRGIHRGHLLARCLGGEGGRINWVPLSASSNVTSMWSKVEETVFEWVIQRGNWARVDIKPNYSIGPIPDSISYRAALMNSKAEVDRTINVVIPNDFTASSLYFYQQANWS